MPTRSPRPARVLPPPVSPDTAYQRPELYAYSPPGHPPPRYPSVQHGYPVKDTEWSTPPARPPAAQWGYGGWGGGPPSRRSSGVARILLTLGGTLATVFFGLVLLGPLALPTVPSQGTISHAPAPARAPGAAPVKPAHALAVLTDNTVYDQGGLANGSCPATDLGSASTDEQTRFYQSLMACLSAEWRPPIAGAGYRYTKPGLVVFDSPVSTPCGNAAPESGRTLAFYCPSGEVMYADVPQMRRFFGSLEVAYAIVIGHEFGHHVQSETGVLAAYDDVANTASADRAELSRRLELQSSCMGGLFLGAVAASFPVDRPRLSQLQQLAGTFGDEPGAGPVESDHGSGESNRRWIFAGFGHNDIAQCNTFRAGSSEVR